MAPFLIEFGVSARANQASSPILLFAYCEQGTGIHVKRQVIYGWVFQLFQSIPRTEATAMAPSNGGAADTSDGHGKMRLPAVVDPGLLDPRYEKYLISDSMELPHRRALCGFISVKANGPPGL